MSEETSRDDIRRLLKTFGIQADEALVAYLATNPDGPPLQVRIALEVAGEDAPLAEIEGEVRR